MLQNRTYLGKVKYQAYQRNCNGSRSFDAPMQWFEGQHGAFIDARVVRQMPGSAREKATHHQPTKRYNTYLLRNLVYCYRCCRHPRKEKTFQHYGKMRPQSQKDDGIRYYRCRSRELGYTCDQAGCPLR